MSIRKERQKGIDIFQSTISIRNFISNKETIGALKDKER